MRYFWDPNQINEMGFAKSNEHVTTMVGLPADNNKEFDQVMNLNGVNSIGDIGQNVDDIMQVIQSMEGIEESSLQTGTIIPSEPNDPGGFVAGINMLSETFSSFERELLNEIDVMGLLDDNLNATIDSVELQRENSIRTLQDTVELWEFEAERRCAFLLRRLRKLQARMVGRHIAEENTGVLEMAHRSVKKYFLQRLSNKAPKDMTLNKFPGVNATLGMYLQKIENLCLAQSSLHHRSHWIYFGGPKENVINANRHTTLGMSPVKIDVDEVENVAGTLASHLHLVKANLDSDCTASSSGGESCDEMEKFNNPHQQQLPISKRAAWRYAQERAGIAFRWTWLQAQLADLAYQIHRYNDLQFTMKLLKERGDASTDGELPASRTRPYVKTSCRKRKLVPMDGIHQLSKRAARPSTVRCDCDHVLASCALCTGRINPTQPQDPLEHLSVSEKIASVDPCYHPVLSFPDDIVHSTHFDAVMKSSEWQQKVLRGSMRMTRVKEKESIERRNETKLPEHNVLAARIHKNVLMRKENRRPMNTGRRRRDSPGSLNWKTRVSKVSEQADDDDTSLQFGSCRRSSSILSSLQQNPMGKMYPKEKITDSHVRLKQNSYDIDNIVIPYSVAASTRLEKLQYKEILTPKWRICGDLVKTDVKNGVMHRPSQDSDVEDVSEETIALRHERSEREECKKFMSYANLIPYHRIRNNRRADSGANTPDPMSLYPCEILSPIRYEDYEYQILEVHRSTSLQNAIRRRTETVNLQQEDSNISTGEGDDKVLPYDARVFPLSKDVYDKMIKGMSDNYWGSPTSDSHESRVEDKGEYDLETESTESAYTDVSEEDSTDPEWIVSVTKAREKVRYC